MCIGMLNDSFKYYNVSSYIHSFNPLCKIVVFIIFLVMVIFCSSFKGIIALSLVLSFIIGLSKIPYKIIFKPIWCIRYLLLVLFVIGLFFNSFIVFKICFIIVFYNIFVMTTSINDCIFGFYSLFLPFKVFGFFIDKISIYCGLFLNFIPFFIDEYRSYSLVLVSRGICDNKFKDRFCSFINVFSSTYRKVLNKCDIMYVRGLSISKVSFSFKLTDVYMVICNLVVLVLVLVKEVVV